MRNLWIGFAIGGFAALLSLGVGACAPTGGGLGKPPENAICAWIQFPGERLYVCAAPAELKALESQAATARSKAGQK